MKYLIPFKSYTYKRTENTCPGFKLTPSGSVVMENQNLKEVNTWMTEDVVSWLKDTGQDTIKNIIIGTIIMMYRLPFTVSLNTTWGKKGVP